MNILLFKRYVAKNFFYDQQIFLEVDLWQELDNSDKYKIRCKPMRSPYLYPIDITSIPLILKEGILFYFVVFHLQPIFSTDTKIFEWDYQVNSSYSN